MSDKQTGTVKWFKRSKGIWLYPSREGGPDVLAHYTNIVGSGFRSLKEGQSVSFTIGEGKKGPQAENIEPQE